MIRARPDGDDPPGLTGTVPLSLPFILATATILLGLTAWWVWIASRSWFVGDDFIFLDTARRPKGWADWWNVFLPFGRHLWWSYRPLTIDVYYYLGLRAFGLDAFGYLLVSLLFHLGSGLLVYRLGWQLGFDRRVAAVTAILSVCRYPSMMQMFWASAFQHVAAKLFFLLAASLFLDHARGRPTRYQVGSCVALVLALWSNELAATLPAVLVCVSLFAGGPPDRSRFLRLAIWRPLPHLAIGGAYLLFRLVFLETAARLGGVYATGVGWNVAANYLFYARAVFDGHPGKLWAAMLLVGVALAGIVASGANRRLLPPLLRTNALCLAWIVLVMVPFAGFLAPHHRFAMIMEPPVSLLLGVYLNAAWAAFSPRHPWALEAGLTLLLLAAIPYGVLRSRTTEPIGWSNRHLLELIDRHHADLPAGSCIVFLYGGNGLATKAEVELFKFRVGGMFGVLYPGRGIRVEIQDARQAPAPASRLCRRFVIKPGLRLDLAQEHR